MEQPIDVTRLLIGGGYYFLSICGVVIMSYYAVRSFRSDIDKLTEQTEQISTKVDSIQRTLSEIQIKAAAHDAMATGMAGHVESIDRRVTFLERRERVG